MRFSKTLKECNIGGYKKGKVAINDTLAVLYCAYATEEILYVFRYGKHNIYFRRIFNNKCKVISITY